MTQRLDAILSPAALADEWASRVRNDDPLGSVDMSAFVAVAGGLVRHLADGAALDGIDPTRLAVDHLMVLRQVVQDRIATSESSGIGLLPDVNRAIDGLILDCVHGQMHHLELDAYADPLTGVGNRRALERDLHLSLAQVERYGHALSVVMIDLDGLKAVNDGAGHEAGDALIKDLAASGMSQLRSGDALYRVGGDEFVAVLLHANHNAAEAFLGRVRSVAPSFSFGVATAPADGTDVAGLLDVADQRLLVQRGPGRDRRRTPAPPSAPAIEPAAPDEGIVVSSVTTTTSLHSTLVEVSVRQGDAEGTAHTVGPPSPAVEPRLAAAATLDAIQQLGYRVDAANLDSAEPLRIGTHDLLTVVLSYFLRDDDVVAVGSAVVRRGLADAAARAVVQAIPPSWRARQIIQI